VRCEEALELMLEADLEELAGRGGSALAAHAQSCARCAATAERLLAGERLLAAALDEIRPRAPVDEAIAGLMAPQGRLTDLRKAAASHEAIPGAGGAGARAPRLDRSRRLWRRGVAAALPLATAAALALLLIRDDPAPPEPLPIARVRERTAGPVVTVPAGSNAAIFKTSNPKITVVWFY